MKKKLKKPSIKTVNHRDGGMSFYAEGGEFDFVRNQTPNVPTNFEQRMYHTPHIDNEDGSISSHKMMSWSDENGEHSAPTIVYQNGQLVELTPDEAIDYAYKNGEMKTFNTFQENLDYGNNGYKTGTPMELFLQNPEFEPNALYGGRNSYAPGGQVGFSYTPPINRNQMASDNTSTNYSPMTPIVKSKPLPPTKKVVVSNSDNTKVKTPVKKLTYEQWKTGQDRTKYLAEKSKEELIRRGNLKNAVVEDLKNGKVTDNLFDAVAELPNLFSNTAYSPFDEINPLYLASKPVANLGRRVLDPYERIYQDPFGTALDALEVYGLKGAGKLAGSVLKTGLKSPLNNAAKNFAKSVPSSTTNISNITKNLEDLKAAQKFSKKYGYELPKNIKRISESDILTDRTIRGLMNRHNTFARGVGTNWDVIGKSNPAVLEHLDELGIDYRKNPKAAVEYMTTHIPIDTGYGRFGLKKGENALYLSNSLPTAEGYTYGQGYIAKVRRPTDFSSTNRKDWINANDFDVSLNFKGSPFNEGIVKNDYIKRFPIGLRQSLAATGDPNKVTKLLKTLTEKESLYKDLSHQSWRKYNNRISDLEYKTDAKHRLYTLSDDPIIRDSPNYLDKLKLKMLETRRDLTSSYYQLLPLKDAVKGIYGDPDVWKAFGKNLYGQIDPFSHYAIKGTPGKKVLDLISTKQVHPAFWENTSRGHINKYSKKLTRREKGGEMQYNMGGGIELSNRMYEEGGEYELSDQEIQDLRNQGYDIELL